MSMKRTQTYSREHFNYEKDNKKISIVYTRTGDNETITIEGGNIGESTNESVYSFDMLSEIVDAVRSLKQAHKRNLKAPTVIDHRNEDEAKVESVVTQIQDTANNIQSRVDESMKKFDSNVPAVHSFIKSDEDDDGIGIDIDKLDLMPETPEEIKKQFEQITKDRINASRIKEPKKTIKRKEGDDYESNETEVVELD